jgi:predicted PurR-regulated permease PerM
MDFGNGPDPGPDREEPAPASVPSPKVEGPLVSGRPLRPVALALLTLLLIGLCVYLAVPFRDALAWALALAIIAWPIHAWIGRHVPYRSLAAVLSTVAVLVLILVPGLFVTYELAQEATSAADRVKAESAGGVVRGSMEKTPGLRTVIEWSDRAGVDLDQSARQLVASYTQDAGTLIQGTTAALLQAAVALFVLYHLFRDRFDLTRSVRALLPLTRDETDQVFRQAAEAVRANLYANVLTSVVAATGGGIMFWLTGLPSPVLWAVVMFFLSLLPVLSSALVWVPAAVYLALIGHWPQAAALGTWGVVNSVVVDNLMYVWLAGHRMKLHQVPSLIAIMGGLYWFGMSGMVLGPAILAVTVAVLQVWHHRMAVTPPTGPAVAEPERWAANGPGATPDDPARVRV